MMNKGVSNHGHYRNNHGFLFDLRPKLQVFQLDDAELDRAFLRVPLTRRVAMPHINAQAYAPETTKESDLK